MIQLIALDIDGTLLNSKGQITLKTKSTIKKYQEQGVRFTLASGRSAFMLQSILRELEIMTPIICNNGCVIQNPISGEVLYEKFLCENIIKMLIRRFKYEEIESYLYPMTDKGILVSKDTKLYHVFKDYEAKGKPKDVKKYVIDTYRHEHEALIIMLNMIEDLNIEYVNDLEEVDLSRIIHISLHFIEKQKEIVRAILQETLGGQAAFVTTASDNFDIFSINHNKGVGLKNLCKALSLNSKEVGAVGNEFNDLEMLEYAGVGVAMGNASEFIKNKANMVVRTNDEEGVSEAIEKLVQIG